MSELFSPIRPLQRAKHNRQVFTTRVLVHNNLNVLWRELHKSGQQTTKYYFNLKMHFCTQELETPRLYFTPNLTNKKVQLHEDNRRW